METLFDLIEILLVLSFSLIFGFMQLCLLCGLFGTPLWRGSKNLFFKLREKRIKHNRFDM